MSDRAVELINDETNELWFSTASLWEISIKSGLGCEDFQVDTSDLRRGLLEHGYSELVVDGLHAIHARDLPLLHNDPSDRI